MTVPQVTDAQAKAITTVATLGTTAITEGSNLARYIGRIVGTTPDDAVGLVIGDPLHAIRTITADWYDRSVKAIIERRNAKTQPVSLSVALPLIRGAYDESREELRDLWAALIAAAMDPDRAERVRISFIDTLKRFDPLDALILKLLHDTTGMTNRNPVDLAMKKLGITQDDAIMSVENLKAANCLWSNSGISNVVVNSYGRGLLRACSD